MDKFKEKRMMIVFKAIDDMSDGELNQLLFRIEARQMVLATLAQPLTLVRPSQTTKPLKERF